MATKGSAARRVRFALLSIALFGATACAHAGNRPLFSRAPGRGGDKVTISVDNQNFLDANVYALWNGQRDRVGMVTGKTAQDFDVSFRNGDLQLEIDLIAGQTMTSDRISVFEGDNVQLVIPPTQS